MANPNSLIGLLSNLFYNSGTYGSPVWAPVTLVGDLKIDGKWDTAEALTRGSRVKLKQKTSLDMGITGKLLSSLTDAAYLALMLTFYTDAVTDFMALNGTNTTNGARGWRFDGQIIAGGEDQGPGNVLWTEFEITPALTANPPASALVATGAAVFTSR